MAGFDLNLLKTLCQNVLDGAPEAACFSLGEIIPLQEGVIRVLLIGRADIFVKMKVEERLVRGLADQAKQIQVIFVGDREGKHEPATPLGLDFQPLEAPANRRRKQIPGIQSLVVVGSGKGGVGKSTIAANLACALAQDGLRVGILDADIHGPSLALMFGLVDRPQVDANQRLIPHERFGLKVISMGALGDPGAPIMWRGPMAATALRQFLFQVVWGRLDTLIIDLPPGTSDVHLTLLDEVAVDGALVVSTPSLVAWTDTAKAIGLFQKTGIPLLGLVENMSYHDCSRCHHRDYLFGSQDLQHMRAEKLIEAERVSIPIHPGLLGGAHEGRPGVIDDPLLSAAFAPLVERVKAVLPKIQG